VRLIDSDGSDLFDLSRDNRSVVKSKSPLLYLRPTHETHGPSLPAGQSVAGVADFNGDTQPDYLLFNAATRGTVIRYMSGVARTGSRNGPTIPAGFEVAGLADFDGNGSPDYLLYNSSTRQTAVWYLNNYLLIGNAAGPTIWAGWSVVAP
jgi:hypothetical protein